MKMSGPWREAGNVSRSGSSVQTLGDANRVAKKFCKDGSMVYKITTIFRYNRIGSFNLSLLIYSNYGKASESHIRLVLTICGLRHAPAIPIIPAAQGWWRNGGERLGLNARRAMKG